MKTISNLSASTVVESNLIESGLSVNNTQGSKSFWRRQRHCKNGTYVESSTGGGVFIPASEIYALAEAHDTNLTLPKKS